MAKSSMNLATYGLNQWFRSFFFLFFYNINNEKIRTFYKGYFLYHGQAQYVIRKNIYSFVELKSQTLL